MYYLDHPFMVTTRTSRRPTPLTYKHLRSWVEAESHFIPITSIEQLTNVNQYLEQQATLYVSNIIQQSISQMIGQSDAGFATIKATLSGALHIALAGDLSSVKTIERSKIDIDQITDNIIIIGTPFKYIKILFITFTVADEVNIIFKTGSTAITGSMDFGGTLEPRGMVLSHGFAPLIMASGDDFKIYLDTEVQVSGYCISYKDS